MQAANTSRGTTEIKIKLTLTEEEISLTLNKLAAIHKD